jgi:hypothetical protein
MLLPLNVGFIAFSTVCLSVFFFSLSDFVFILLTLHHRLMIAATREKEKARQEEKPENIYKIYPEFARVLKILTYGTQTFFAKDESFFLMTYKEFKNSIQ